MPNETDVPRTLQVTATPEWIARSLIQIARQPATPDDDDRLQGIILNYFQQQWDAGHAAALTRNAEPSKAYRAMQEALRSARAGHINYGGQPPELTKKLEDALALSHAERQEKKE